MSIPDARRITLPHDPGSITALLEDLFAKPRRDMVKWSQITNQTAQVRIAYPGQHLASLVTGMRGAGTAARGIDLADGSEVKSCSRADQLGICGDDDCTAPVLAWQEACPECGGAKIKRKTDSHWILAIKTEAELEQYINGPRLLLVLFDRSDDLTAVRVRVWEIWTREPRHSYFEWFVRDYYFNNFVAKTKAGLTPSPLNFHPLKFDFFMMNPVLVFEARVDSVDTVDSSVRIIHWVPAEQDRSALIPEPMPARSIMSAETWSTFLADSSDDDLSALTSGVLSAEDIGKLRPTRSFAARLKTEIEFLDADSRLRLLRQPKKPKMTRGVYRRRRPL